MENKNNNKTKRFHRIIFSIVSIITIFCLLSLSCFAYQSGNGYSLNVCVGTNTYPFINLEGFKYVTLSQSGNYYTKDIPTSNGYTVNGSRQWEGLGQPLGLTTWNQTIFSGEVNMAFQNPKTYISSYNWFASELPSYYTQGYFNPRVDCVRYYVTHNEQYNSSPYQRALLNFSDFSISSSAIKDTIQRNMISPSFRTYVLNSHKDNILPVTLAYTVSGRSSLDGTIFTRYYTNVFELSYSNYDNTNYYTNFSLLGRILPTLSDYELTSDYLTFKDVMVCIGDWYEQLPLSDDSPFYNNGARIIDIYQPSLRPYAASYNTPEDSTYIPDAKFQTINHRLNELVEQQNGSASNDVTNLSPFGASMASVIGGFLEIEILPMITFGGILFTIVSIGFVMAVLKYFAGG